MTIPVAYAYLASLEFRGRNVKSRPLAGPVLNLVIAAQNIIHLVDLE
jgi:hypothetical protein